MNETSNMETVALLRDAGANPYYYTCDLSKKHEIKKYVQLISIILNLLWLKHPSSLHFVCQFWMAGCSVVAFSIALN